VKRSVSPLFVFSIGSSDFDLIESWHYNVFIPQWIQRSSGDQVEKERRLGLKVSVGDSEVTAGSLAYDFATGCYVNRITQNDIIVTVCPILY
jgi:hypothetical protein